MLKSLEGWGFKPQKPAPVGPSNKAFNPPCSRGVISWLSLGKRKWFSLLQSVSPLQSSKEQIFKLKMVTTNLLNKTLVCLYFSMILMTSQTLCFMSSWCQSKTHQDITRDAVLLTTADVCRSRALQEGRNLILPEPLTVKSVAKACSSSDSAKEFQSSINEINHHNAWVDFWHFFSAHYHFENEEFMSGRQLITEGVFAVKYSVKQKNYQAAREALGKVLHTLQDFYSNSNWIELGNTEPYSNLIKPDTPIRNIADSETCRSCYGDACAGGILEEIIAKQKLTSGYFDWSKPKGKCSHGGLLKWEQGGINKDTVNSSHGYLHYTAASVATKATRELLQDIRAAVGDSEFLRLMGLRRSSVLCFVIDTTSTMSYDIAEIRRVTSSIIDSKTGTAAQSIEYILVPFNDINYGPLTRTTDANVFKQKLSAITADGGAGAFKMSLSALQLALTGSPPQTEIYVFTDADAKDKGLTSTVRALIERTKSKVTFMLTTTRHCRSSGKPVDGHHHFSTQTSLYHNLAQASGGLAIEVTKRTLAQVTDIIAVTSGSKLVTLFQATRKTGKAEKFSVFVDSSVQNLTIYITGNSPVYTITSPTGVSQKSTELSGMLGFIQKVGNFHTVKPNITEQTGLWLFRISSMQSYTIRVVGQSEVDFMFDFVVKQLNPGYALLNSRPATNNSAALLVTMVGADSLKLTKVSLVPSASSISLSGTPEEVSSGQYLVIFNSIPEQEFTVRVDGQLDSGRSLGNTFQRQTPTRFQTSTVTITTQPVGTMEPGTPFTLLYTVTTKGSGGRFNIRVSNNRSFVALYKTSITLVGGRSVDDIVTLFAPENTSSGTDVTVTIQAEAVDGIDYNYVSLRLIVLAPVADFTPPVCEAVSLNANCSGNCSLSTWYLTANVTDGSGSGVENVRVLYGNGNLSTTTVLNNTGVNVTMVIYSSSCCSTDLELVAVDAEGNVATCYKFVKDTTSSTSTGSPGTVTNNTIITTIAASMTAPTGTTASTDHPITQTGISTAYPTIQTSISTALPTSETSLSTNKTNSKSTTLPTSENNTKSTAPPTTKTHTSTYYPSTETNPTSTSYTTTETNTSTSYSTTKTNTSTPYSTTKINTTSTDHPTIQTSSNGAECCLFLPFLWLNIGIFLYQFIRI
ncbi:von Willebrand factor A domain-containing protein 7-like [Silurus meridionalis]|nr:von Willebrand factor A domain-containing protein 7-like [Silurus meridionalis]